MATKIFKLAIDAVTTTTTEINPAIESYFYDLREDERTGDTITIPATQFTDDEGNIVVGNLTTVTENNGYYLLFINGVLQQTSIYTVSGDGSQVVITDAASVPIDSPITLIVNNFAPVSDSDTTLTT